jgi:predicted anti-sigma-YlaC factor YlaD
MMTCKDVSTLLSSGALSDAPLSRRLAARLHLAMCRHCRAFRRQLNVVAGAARRTSAAFEAEPPEDFESDIVKRLVPGVGRAMGNGR